VERTLAWISCNRRLARDFENLARTARALIYLAMIKLMVSACMGFRLSSRSNAGMQRGLLTDGDDPRRARQLGVKLAPQPCIRLDPRGTRTMKQQMRFGGEAPRRRTHSRYGMKAMRLLGHRHLGSR
jgi:hypothetical protein